MHDVLTGMAKARRPPLGSVSHLDARVTYESRANVLEIARPQIADIDELLIPLRDGQQIAARLYRPQDAQGVAPAWIGLAECDPLVDEGIQYADKLRAAGVQVDLEIYRGVTHEFIKMGRVIPEALLAHADAARAMRQHLQP